MATEREIRERARALSLLDTAIGALLDLTIEDQARARTLQTVAANLRTIQCAAMSKGGEAA